MNTAFAASGIVLMGLGGFTMGAQLIASMSTSVLTSPEVAMLAVAGLLVDGVGFVTFMKGFKNYSL
ncbi:hypothetical protein [Methylobacterium sp. SyP6R]|uniref:hypothetical protein n=1 Tax=Methylobacterium sp. SyP6R TaxID=2718876 RepID=UPI001F2B3358|nr:hypothetical protein [Methylobacterium sp. SyP6R]MCF4130059.1 hypothetical protein [Methylobacterium sp. SyP6R]